MGISASKGEYIALLDDDDLWLPLVGTRVGGIPYLVDHEVTGFLTEPGDPRDLAQAIRRLVLDPGLCREFGKRAREKVLKHFTWPHIAARTMRVYEQAIRIAHADPRISLSVKN